MEEDRFLTSNLLSISKATDPVNLLDLELHPIARMDLVPRKPPFRIMMATEETFFEFFSLVGISLDLFQGSNERNTEEMGDAG